MSIGSNIKHYRRSANLTQKNFATLIDKSERMIQKYESGDVTPSLEMLDVIAEVLECHINDLISLDLGCTEIPGYSMENEFNGNKITEFRNKLGISQRELGRRSNISGQMISKIENNLSKPSIETLNSIANALNCRPGDLLGASLECSIADLTGCKNYSIKTPLSEYSTDELMEELRKRLK